MNPRPWYWSTLILFAALLAFLSVWVLLIRDLHGGNPFAVLSVHIVPLLIFIPWLIAGRRKAFQGLCFVLNLYFIQGVTTAFEPGRLWLGTSEALLTTAVFISAMLYARADMQRARRALGL
ncbi:DUF2069 domain-containing protein [Atopomonas sediminilitoris]|uniref:DUF2069 domain-containing protein n=1 Tax=Atopomonas sediminilitoris TaxID=2919919 RepID=UPI001F4F0B87|nr:DUF2069 domain-containing protein [Atopomonas sediminilitoris]MCJ8169287.1 DUF2069 domain-containing protein [Atopomonas sediminilitoris]